VADNQAKDLANLVQVNSFKVSDKDGKTHTLTVLDLGDISEIYVKYGDLEILTPKQEIDAITGDIKPDKALYEKILFLAWLAMRKEGLTESQLDVGDWSVSLTKVGRMFTYREFPQLLEGVISVLVVSGLWQRAEETPDPTSPGQAAGTNVIEMAETPEESQSIPGERLTQLSP